MLLDFGKVKGRIKELNGVNCAPYKKSSGKDQSSVKKIFDFAGITRSRLHDCMGEYGGCYYIDVPNIFRNFDADENLAENYDFYYSDEYITAIVESGVKIVYRLGVTIEWGSKKYACNPPRDFEKWAKICEHIVMHYNKGWADGFNYGIEYWEIWNEPENPPMWTGTREQFFELYKTASKYLKAKFPELKIGGYGSCGMYAAFERSCSDFYKSFLVWFDEFLKMCRDSNAPLDFFSWHIYTSFIEQITKSAEYVRNKLDEYGFKHTESHLNEWNYGAENGGFDDMDTLKGAGFICSALIAMQNTSVDFAQYYCLSYGAAYNGFLYQRTGKYSPVIYVYNAFSDLFKAGHECAVVCGKDDPPALAAKGDNGMFALISNYGNGEKKINIELKGAELRLFELSGDGGFKEISPACDNFEITVKKDGVYFLG